MILLICFIILDVLSLSMFVMTIITCAKKLSPTYHITHTPTVIHGEVLDVIPEGSFST